jgi:hypothetical protein
VTVIHGTKGGKTRRSPPLDRQRAAGTCGGRSNSPSSTAASSCANPTSSRR